MGPPLQRLKGAMAILSTRKWQRRFHAGALKRNSPAAKPAIWFFQLLRLRQIKETSRLRAYERRVLR